MTMGGPLLCAAVQLHFQPDWEAVIAAVLSWLSTDVPQADVTKLVLWGRSFGGYLAPRAFANLPSNSSSTPSTQPTLAALVADGGIWDMYQVRSRADDRCVARVGPMPCRVSLECDCVFRVWIWHLDHRMSCAACQRIYRRCWATTRHSSTR